MHIDNIRFPVRMLQRKLKLKEYREKEKPATKGLIWNCQGGKNMQNKRQSRTKFQKETSGFTQSDQLRNQF